MSVLVATGVLSSYIFSVILTLLWSHESYYEAAALLITFVLFYIGWKWNQEDEHLNL